MALTSIQKQANKDYAAGKITANQYKDRYVTLNKPKTITPKVTTPKLPKVASVSDNKYTSPGGKTYDVYDPNSGQPPRAGQIQITNPKFQTNQPSQSSGGSTSNLISEGAKAQTNTLLAALKQRIAESKAGQQNIIDRAPQSFNPLRASSEVSKAQNLRAALERSSLQGDRGGIGRSAALATQTAGEKRLGDINLAEQNVVSGAEGEIARLSGEELTQADQIRAGVSSQEIQNQLDERNRQENIRREDTARQESLDLAEQLRTDERARQVGEVEKQDFLNTITQFGADFQAEINNIANDDDPSNDWKLPYLRTARQQKIQRIEQDRLAQEQAQQEAQQDTQSQARDDAEFRLKQFGYVANEQDAQILGVPVGTRTADYQNQLSIISNRNRTSTPKVKDKFSTSVFEDGIKNIIGTLGSVGEFGEVIPPSQQEVKALTADFIVREYDLDNMSKEQASELMIQNNITERDITQAENRIELLEGFRR